MAKQRTKKNFLQKIWGNLRSGFSLKGPTSFEQFFGLLDDDTIVITPETAKTLSAAYTCLKIRSEDFAQLPKGVYSKTAQRTIHHAEHPVNKLVNEMPNGYQTAYDFWKIMIQDRDSYGNGMGYIERDNRFNPIAIHRIKPWELKKVELDPEEGLMYHFRDGMISGANILHLKEGSSNGLTGTSPLKTNRDTLELAKRQERYSRDTTGKKPPAVLVVDGRLTPDQMTELQRQFAEQAQGGATPVLPEGMKYMPTMFPPNDVELIEAMRLTAHQIYGIYRIPPTMAGDYTNSPYASAEAQDITYVKYSLMPGIVQAEQEIKTKLLTRRADMDKYIKININGFLRADSNARANFYNTGIANGYLSPNDARRLEDLDPYQDGDKFYMNSATIPVDQMEEFWGSKSQPKAPKVSNKIDEEKVKQNGKGHKV